MANELDPDAFQAQIDMSLAQIQSMVASWMKPLPGAQEALKAQEQVEKDIEFFSKRPSFLGVGAPIPKGKDGVVHGSDIARLKGRLAPKLTKISSNELGAAGKPGSDDDSEEESRSRAFTSKATAKPKWKEPFATPKAKGKPNGKLNGMPNGSDPFRPVSIPSEPPSANGHQPSSSKAAASKSTPAKDASSPPFHSLHSPLELPSPGNPLSPSSLPPHRTPPPAPGSPKIHASESLEPFGFNTPGGDPFGEEGPEDVTASPSKKRRKRRKKHHHNNPDDAEHAVEDTGAPTPISTAQPPTPTRNIFEPFKPDFGTTSTHEPLFSFSRSASLATDPPPSIISSPSIASFPSLPSISSTSISRPRSPKKASWYDKKRAALLAAGKVKKGSK